MKRFEVFIPPIVREQILAQVLYIARDSIDRALAWEDRLRAAIKGIGELPADGEDEDASSRLGESIRKCVFEGTYLIHYRIREAHRRIEIVNFRHGTRLPRTGEP